MGFLVGRALGGLRNRAVQIPGAAAACARPLELSAHLQRDHLLILQNDRVCLHAFPLRLLQRRLWHDTLRELAWVPTCTKRHSFLSFPYVCPEPVLVKCSFYI
jgi:hypothetical protein